MNTHPSDLVFACYLLGGCLVLAAGRLLYLSNADEPIRIDPIITTGGATVVANGDGRDTAVSYHVQARANQQLENLKANVERTRDLLEQRTKLLKEKNAECDALRHELDESISLLFSIMSEDNASDAPTMTADQSERIEGELNDLRAELKRSSRLSHEQTETVESLRVLLTEAELDIADLQAVSTDELTALAREQNALANATSQAVLQFGADALPALTTLTGDPQPAIRIWAANTLGRIGLQIT
jgi:hypothetical protein